MGAPCWGKQERARSGALSQRSGRSGCGRTGARSWPGAGRYRDQNGEVGRMAVRKIAHPSIEDRKAKGLEARDRTPPSSHTQVAPGRGPARPGRAAGGAEHHPRAGSGAGPPRPDDGLAVHLLPGRGQDHGRGPEGHAGGRAGAQLCGDAHLSNFGAFASPERRLLFDLNDFDETLPGPFEYDVKRMAASFTIAARNNGFAKADARAATLASVRAYREAMAAFAQMRDDGHLVRPPGRGRADGRDPQRGGRDDRQGGQEAGEEGRRRRRSKSGQAGGEGGQDGGEAGGEDRREGAHPRQPAGAVQARRAGRRAVPDRQPAADRRPGARPGRHLRPVPRRGRAR